MVTIGGMMILLSVAARPFQRHSRNESELPGQLATDELLDVSQGRFRHHYASAGPVAGLEGLCEVTACIAPGCPSAHRPRGR